MILSMTNDALIVVLSGVNVSLQYQRPSLCFRNMIDTGPRMRHRARMLDSSLVYRMILYVIA